MFSSRWLTGFITQSDVGADNVYTGGNELVVSADLPHAQTMVAALLDPNGRRVHVEGIEGTNNFVIGPKRRKLVHAAYHLRVTDLLGRVVTRTVVR